jgi:glycine dehydrogenase subunit 1
MAARVTKRQKAIVSGGVHPQYTDVIETVGGVAGLHIDRRPPVIAKAEDLAALIDADTACVVAQNPGFFGDLQNLAQLADAAHAKGALLIVIVTEVVSLGAITPPGHMGADIVVAEGQSLGVGLQFGGPYVGLFASRQKFVRQMPGRLCGETVDANGRRGYVLTLSTREQHIRREKATSNICTNSGLMCLAFAVHLALLGEEGFKRLALLNHESAVKLAEALARVPRVEVVTPHFFNEFTLRLPKPAAFVVDRLVDRGVLGGVPAARLLPDHGAAENLLLVAATEINTDDDRAAFARALREVLS